MQKIIPHLWFNNQAEEAVNLYISIFNNSGILQLNRYEEEGANISGMAKDTVMTVDFKLEGQEFIALNGGPAFTFTQIYVPIFFDFLSPMKFPSILFRQVIIILFLYHF